MGGSSGSWRRLAGSNTGGQDEVTWLGEYYDVTKIREAEASLRETSTRYRTMLEQVPLAIYLEHVNTNSESVPCFYVSPQITGLTGYTPDEWQEPRRWEHALHPEDRDRIRTRWAEATRKRGQFVADYRLIAQDGGTVWIHDEAVLVIDEQGEPKYWHGFMLDITREKEAESHLRQSEAEFRLLFSRNPLPAWVYDRETLAILEVNERAIEHYGYAREEFLDLVVTDLVHPGLEPHGREIYVRPCSPAARDSHGPADRGRDHRPSAHLPRSPRDAGHRAGRDRPAGIAGPALAAGIP